MGGSAPPFVLRMNAQKVPYGGILVTLVIYAFGVVLNYLLPAQVFEIVLNIASLGVIATWGIIVICQMKLRQAQDSGEIPRVSFRMPFAPVMSWATLVFLVGVLVLMAFDYPDGTFTIAALPLVVILLGIGWRVLKGTSPFAPTAPSYVLTHQVELDESAP
jgi:L-asparagine permease